MNTRRGLQIILAAVILFSISGLTAASSGEWVQTTTGDFNAGVKNGVVVVEPGDVKLDGTYGRETLDQSQTQYGYGGNTKIYENKWKAQTFTPEITGALTNVTLHIKKYKSPSPLVVELRNCTEDGEPGTLVYATAERDDITTTGFDDYNFTFNTPHDVTADIGYSIVIHQKDNGGDATNYYHVKFKRANPYDRGIYCDSSDGGVGWSRQTAWDFYFKTYVKPVSYSLSGMLESHTYDTGRPRQFYNISWNITASDGITAVKFQIRTTHDYYDTGFVGPDGTSTSYYATSPAPINNTHNGYSKVQYKAFLSSNDVGKTPVLHDIRITYSENEVPPVPEPSTLALISVGLILFICISGFKRLNGRE